MLELTFLEGDPPPIVRPEFSVVDEKFRAPKILPTLLEEQPKGTKLQVYDGTDIVVLERTRGSNPKGSRDPGRPWINHSTGMRYTSWRAAVLASELPQPTLNHTKENL